MEKVIEVKNLTKEYKEQKAVDNLSFDVYEGEILGLLGPNGSGKSTTINSILALLKYQNGSIKIFGKDMKPDSYDIKSKIGVIFQEVAVFNELNVYDNINYFCGLYIEDKNIRKQYVEDAIELVGLGEFKKYLPKQLSGGLLRRLNIACGIAHKPKLIFLDEPTVAVDPQSRNNILDGIKKLRDDGATIVYTTHYMEEVIDADRVVVVDGGRIVDDGTPREIFSQVEQLKRYHLDVPQVTELAWELKKDGLPFKDGVLSVNEFTDEFKRVCDADFSVHGAQVSGKENYSENNCSKTMNSEQEKVLLQLSHVTHVYDPDSKESFPALNDLSLSIHKNEFIGIIGHTGSGKSTLIQHLNGLMKPTSGTITYDGKDIWQDGYPLKELRSKVGLVFQYPEYQLFEESVFKDVCFGPKNQGLIEDEVKARATEALKMVGIDESLYEASPFELSGGQKRRVAIAGVLAMNPQILILDEPTAGLDPKGRDDILGQIAKLQKERGITIVLVSHSMEDVAQYASRILVVNGGKIVFDDKPRKVFEHEKELNEMGLAIPQVTQLMHRLKSEGYPVFENAITVQEARKNLLIYFQGKKKQDCKSKDQNNQDQKSQIESRRKPEGKTV